MRVRVKARLRVRVRVRVVGVKRGPAVTLALAMEHLCRVRG